MIKRERVYTILLDYSGGTYISQVTASTPESAVREWVREVPRTELRQWGLTDADMTGLLDDDQPTPVKGCSNVWCLSNNSEDDELMLIHIIGTDIST